MKILKGICWTIVILVFLFIVFLMMIGEFGSMT